MNEEKFVKAEADATTLLIAARLGERKRKIGRMAEMEQNIASRGRRRHLYVRTLLAACVLAALLVWPIYRAQMSPIDRLDIAPPTMTEYRAANADLAEITSLVGKKNYDVALVKTRLALEKSDRAIRELRDVTFGWDDEELAYEEELEKTANSELRWTYIYLLVRLDKTQEAKAQLKRYLKDKQHSEHRAEAAALLKEIE